MLKGNTNNKTRRDKVKDVIQKELEPGIETMFDMQLRRSKFLVKNFTDDKIKVKLGNNTTCSIIGPLSFEVVFNNINNNTSTVPEVTDKVYVTAEAKGLVEVASMDD